MQSNGSAGHAPLERTPLLEAADITFPLRLTRWQRFLRWLAGQKPLDLSAAAQAEFRSQAALDPFHFDHNEEGSGAFGRWILDSDGLPAYDYDMNQRRDARAYYVNSEGRDRRDHWHQIGNDRITALVSNDGVVQFYAADRGGTFLNRFQAFDGERPRELKGYVTAGFRLAVAIFGRIRITLIRLRSKDAKTPRGTTEPHEAPPPPPRVHYDDATRKFALSGGFSYIGKHIDGGSEDQAWATAFRYAPDGAKTHRVFGMGYYETELTYEGIRQTRRVYAPYRDDPAWQGADMNGRSAVYTPDGSDPLLLIDVELENQTSAPVQIRYYEYWDVNVHQLQVQWVRSGIAAYVGDVQRGLINERFASSVQWLPDSQVLRFQQERCGGAFYDGIPSEVDIRPANVFLANLNDPAVYPAQPYVDMIRFFGEGGAQTPDAVRFRHEPTTAVGRTPAPMPYCLVLRHDLTIPAGQTVKLRYAYGTVEPGKPLSMIERYRVGDWFGEMKQVWKKSLGYFTTGRDITLQREMAWHSYKLISATLYSDYYKAHYTPQGSAYLYLHGADGAPRDQCLFVLPMTYLRPALAKDMLRLLMRLQHFDTLEFPYSFVGDGIHSNALGLHAEPSDLDLFFLWSIAEYLTATGDREFLVEECEFYPRGIRPHPALIPGITTLDHIHAAYRHLTEVVGFGSHGLLRIGDGDWDDAVVVETSLRNVAINRQKTICRGESVPNSQMALYILPLIAALIESADAALAGQMRDTAATLKAALMNFEGDETAWNPGSKWYNRAFLRDFDDNVVVLNDNHIGLQPQPWAMISGLSQEMGVEDDLIASVKRLLDDPSPTGGMQAEKGQVWHAVSQLLTWGYRRSRPDLAWRQLNRNTFAVHAIVFPNIWFNIWSGPDGTNGIDAPNPGGTWTSPVTPMTDFPAMNANPHAMALLGLIRVCGIEPVGDGLLIAPKAPPQNFVLDLPLLRLEFESGRITGLYRSFVAGEINLHIRIPETPSRVSASIDGTPVEGLPDAVVEVTLPLRFARGQNVSFRVTWESA